MIFFGIDYSSSKLARKKIWISECEIQKRNLLLKDTYCLEEISNKFILQNCNTFIYDLIEKNKNSIFGFDFSFSIPEFFLKDSSWEDFIFSLSPLLSQGIPEMQDQEVLFIREEKVLSFSFSFLI